ncbi:MAG: TM2 domain-containing protein [Spirochaetaceae bacterium]|nr:TM2 domain-containing protein [Spirochaetaceae bacterium]
MALTVAREGRKSYVTAYAFLFHWGILGIHRFYLGRYISGVVWLLTGGLFGIGVFFDIFLTGAYIRFWNEDHQDERPVNRSSSVGRIKQQKVKKVKPPKAPKAVKPPKVKKPKKTKSRESSAEIDTSEEFSFPGDIGTAPANPVEPMLDLEVTEPPVESEPNQDLDLENDFGDLPDLSFDDDGADDFSASPDLPEELGEELSDEDFDIKSLE